MPAKCTQPNTGKDASHYSAAITSNQPTKENEKKNIIEIWLLNLKLY